MIRRLFGLTREGKLERLDVPGGGYQPITFDESPGVPPQGGTGTILRPAHQLSHKSVVPVSPHLVLALPFFLHVHNILDEAQAQMQGGEAVDLDEIALLLSSHLRENLQIVYRPLTQTGS